jgi:uncharacterized protein
MERTTNEITKKRMNGKQIQVLSELVGRMQLASRLGVQSFGGDRDIYEALGYLTRLEFKDYFARYQRQDIAKAIIDRPVNITWQGPVELIETNEPEDTEFEKAWKDLSRKLGLKTRLARVDRLTGIGRYGVLLLGLDDVRDPSGFAQPVSGSRKLLYVKPFSEQTAKIFNYVEKSTDVRYGMPLLYDIEVGDPTTQTSKQVKVHYSRIIHILDGNLESEVYGTPRLEAVFNRLMDLEKLVGGDAEMFWRGARPGFHGKVDPEYTMTQDTKDDLLNQLDEYEHNLRRFLINEGMDIEALTQQISDPSSHVDTQLKMISAETGIPMRVLSGSERGELASSEDKGEWLTYVQGRREEHAEPRILRPFVDRLIELNILPTPSRDYMVKWADLFSISEKARVEIGKSRANALREYTSNPIAQGIIPPTAFMMKFLGFTTDDVELISKIRDNEMEEEVKMLAKIKDELEPTPPPAAPGGNPTRPKSATGTPKAKPAPSSGTPKRIRRPAV